MSQADLHLSRTSVGCKDHPDTPSSSATRHGVGHAVPAGHGYAPQSVRKHQHTLHQLYEQPAFNPPIFPDVSLFPKNYCCGGTSSLPDALPLTCHKDGYLI